MRATRHLLLRDRSDRRDSQERHGWLGNLSGLQADRDGALTLARVPAPSDGAAIDIATARPYAREVSGIALGPCDAVFVSDTDHNRILYVDPLCNARSFVAPDGVAGAGPGQLNQPRGLAFTADALLVADSGNARLQQFALPGLEANRAIPDWSVPVSIAVDTKLRALVVDTAQKRLRRLDSDGTPDAAFDATLAASGRVITPLCVSAGRDDRAIVCDTHSNEVLVFDAHGTYLHSLDGLAGWLPGALAALGRRVYVADAASGAIHAFDDDGAHIGAVPGYRGPVTALAVASSGDLYVKPGLDARYVQLVADQAFVDFGELVAGPFDAGERDEWERAWVDCDIPQGTRLVVDVVQRPDATPEPLAGEWLPLPSSDALLPLVAPSVLLAARRYLWLRARLWRGQSQQSPRLRQLRAATPGERYLDYLPENYGRDNPFVARLLALLRGEYSEVEELLDDVPRVADPTFSATADLPWLAQWLALELPQIADDNARRALIARAVALYARRGTPASIEQFVELHTGIRPTIVEAFDDNGVWILGSTSRLDFDTRLPVLDPSGMVVSDESQPQCCATQDAEDRSPCREPAGTVDASTCRTGPIGRAVVGESGPLAAHQVGTPLFAEYAFRFCVVIDAYRARKPETLAEIRRVIEREKPAHTDYRVVGIQADLRVGLQARVGIDAIVGGDPPGFMLASQLGLGTRLNAADSAARIGDALLGEALTLT